MEGIPRPRRPRAGRRTHDVEAGPNTAVPLPPAVDPLKIPLGDVMSSPVITGQLDETLGTLARRMNRHAIGCLVILEQKRMAGLITERDILRRVAEDVKPSAETAEDIMAKPVVVATKAEDLATAIRRLVANNIKKLPIMERSRLVGIVTLTDFARVEPMFTARFREALEKVDAEARKKFEARLAARAPHYSFI